MDFLRELIKIKEGFMPDFESMSDEELKQLCMDLEAEDLCELDDEGNIVNREMLIRDLEAGHGGGDIDVPMDPMECVVMDGDKEVKTFDTIEQAKDFVKKNKGKKLTIKEAHYRSDDFRGKLWRPRTYISKKHADEDEQLSTGQRVVKNVKRHLVGKNLRSRMHQEVSKAQDASMKSDWHTTKKHSRNYFRLAKLDTESTEQRGPIVSEVEKMKSPANVVKFKQMADGNKKPALPAYGGKQGDVANKKKIVHDEVGNAGMKGMKKKDRPYMEKPRFRDWLTANMFFTMTKSGELAGNMKLGEDYQESSLPVYYVHVPANIYDGKYYDFRTVRVAVSAENPEQAMKIINTNKNAVLEFLDQKRMRVGQRTVRYVGRPIEKNEFFKPEYSVRPAPQGDMARALTRNGTFERVTAGKPVGEPT